MSENRSRFEGNNNLFALKNSPSPSVRRAQAQQLQKELDSLASLLQKVKEQTEKVGEAADAIGDALISQLADDAAECHGRPIHRRPASPSGKASPRAKITMWPVRAGLN